MPPSSFDLALHALDSLEAGDPGARETADQVVLGWIRDLAPDLAESYEAARERCGWG